MSDQDVKIELRPRAPFRAYLERKERWACLVVHRRAGKTFACIQDLLYRALTHQRPGPPLRYAYIAPTRDQAKDIAWGYIEQFYCPIPGATPNKADLSVTLPNGAVVRLYSGDNYERMRGLYFDGVVIDEYADIDPAAWAYVIRPCLSDYNGWATFIGTPKGRNQFWRLWEEARQSPEWFSLILRASESGLIPAGELGDIRRTTNLDSFAQEYECSFSVGRPGAIYARDLEKALAEGRIAETVEWYKELPCYTSFDVGAARNQKVWIWQIVGDRINYLESLSGDEECKTPADWAARLREKRYSYGGHYIPHDAAAAQGGLWQEGLATAGLRGVAPVPRQVDVWDGINLALDAMPRVWMNKSGCRDGLDALDAYHSKEERDGATIGNRPVHNWASHYSDAFSLSHQAIHHGMVQDRTAAHRKIRPRNRPTILTGIRGSSVRRVEVKLV